MSPWGTPSWPCARRGGSQGELLVSLERITPGLSATDRNATPEVPRGRRLRGLPARHAHGRRGGGRREPRRQQSRRGVHSAWRGGDSDYDRDGTEECEARCRGPRQGCAKRTGMQLASSHRSPGVPRLVERCSGRWCSAATLRSRRCSAASANARAVPVATQRAAAARRSRMSPWGTPSWPCARRGESQGEVPGSAPRMRAHPRPPRRSRAKLDCVKCRRATLIAVGVEDVHTGCAPR